MNGSEIQKGLIDAAHIGGWICAHFRPARSKRGWVTPVSADGKGFPDLILVHLEHGYMAVLEVKGAGDTLKQEQERWLAAFRPLEDTGRVAVDVVTSKNYDDWLHRLISARRSATWNAPSAT
jgi:hypothetical protein